MKRIWPPVLVLFAAMGIAEFLIWVFQVPGFLLPRPTAVIEFMYKNPGDLFGALLTTAEAALIGFFSSALLGIAAAIALASSSLIRRAFYPYAVFFQTVPIVAVAPLLMIWCGPGLVAVAISALVVSIFPVIANTLTGLLSVDPALEDLFRLNGASPLARLWKLRFPSATPNIITGLRVAAGLAVIGTVVGEFLVGLLGNDEGLGVRIISAKKLGKTDALFAYVLMASLLGLAMFAAINLAGRLLLRNWHASEKEKV
jgi:NitT/TauT family transport system permease protein